MRLFCPRCRAACCAVVTTAEYCTEVIGALARNVAKLLDPPLGDEVSPRLAVEPCCYAGFGTQAVDMFPPAASPSC